jgi:hypothetical protein
LKPIALTCKIGPASGTSSQFLALADQGMATNENMPKDNLARTLRLFECMVVACLWVYLFISGSRFVKSRHMAFVFLHLLRGFFTNRELLACFATVGK